MATVFTTHAGNRAIEEQCWNLSLHEAQAAIGLLDVRPGSYWDSNLVKPYRRAKRAKADMVRIYTAGFSTGEISNVLYACGSSVQHRATL